MKTNGLPGPLQELIDRKLWPVALLLVAALVAIPMLLSSAEDTSAPPSPVAAAGTTETAESSIVTVGDAAKRDRVRAVLGDRKDPFRPAQLHRIKKENTDGLTTDEATEVDSGGGSGGGAGGGAPTSDGPSLPDVAPTATPEPDDVKTFDLYSLKVRFGASDGELTTREVKRLTGLPGGTHPAALYLGLRNDHKSAVFIIDAGVEALGDGHCDPSPEDCQTLTMKKGETEFLTRGDKQYELDLIDIRVKKTTDEKAAKTSRKTIAVDGRKKLKSLIGRVGSLRYDEDKGALQVVPKAEQAKRAAKAARFDTSGFTSTG